MIHQTWMRGTLIGVYVLVIGLLVAHSIHAFVSLSVIEPAPSAVPAVIAPTAAPDAANPKLFADTIMAAHLFALPPASDPHSGNSQPAPPLPPLNVAKSFLLLGTAVSSSPGDQVILEDLASKKQLILHVDESLPAVGTITRIEKDRVLFRQGPQEEWLNLAIQTLTPGFEYKLIATAHTAAPPAVASSRPLPPPTIPINSGNRRLITRQILADSAKDISVLYSQARPVPAMVQGRSQGVRLEAVNHYSIYGHLGFQSGDIVTRINGVEMSDPIMFTSVLQRMKDERIIRIDLFRNSEPKTLTVDVS